MRWAKFGIVQVRKRGLDSMAREEMGGLVDTVFGEQQSLEKGDIETKAPGNSGDRRQ